MITLQVLCWLAQRSLLVYLLALIRRPFDSAKTSAQQVRHSTDSIALTILLILLLFAFYCAQKWPRCPALHAEYHILRAQRQVQFAKAGLQQTWIDTRYSSSYLCAPADYIHLCSQSGCCLYL